MPEVMENVKFLMNPDSWPKWPICPVKRRNLEKRETEVGIVWADGRPTVILTNMYDIDPAAPTIEYASFQELVEAGWVVD